MLKKHLDKTNVDQLPEGFVHLKNWTTENETSVMWAMYILEDLIKSDPVVFYDLVKKSRDNSYEIAPQTLKQFEIKWLLDPVWNIHELISNVALAAVEWDWLKMRLVDPIWKKIEKKDVKETTNHELHKIITNADNVYFKSKYLKKIWHKLSYNGRKAKILNSKNEGLVVVFQENGEYKWEIW